MQDQHTGVGSGLTDNILEVDGTLLGCRVGSKCLFDRVDIVVDSFGHADHGHLSSMFLQKILGEFGSLSVGVVTANGVKDVDFVLEKALGSNLQRCFALLHKATLQAILGICQLPIMTREER